MSAEERSVWIAGVVAVGAYGVYLVMILGGARGPLHEVEFMWPMVWSIGGAIVAAIVLNIIGSIIWPRGVGTMDVRDRQISRFGDHLASGFVTAGALAAMIMAMLEWDGFWIANVIYLGFVLSAILATVAKLVAYRAGFQPW